ncbi:hypothetical protein TNCV_264931 [Trichonephila clavipes]|nr:hypothetical protein TNCV_264931 [Trichonephila clavipes]
MIPSGRVSLDGNVWKEVTVNRYDVVGAEFFTLSFVFLEFVVPSNLAASQPASDVFRTDVLPYSWKSQDVWIACFKLLRN